MLRGFQIAALLSAQNSGSNRFEDKCQHTVPKRSHKEGFTSITAEVTVSQIPPTTIAYLQLGILHIHYREHSL